MAAVDIYIPVYMKGKAGSKNEGRSAYQFAKVTGVVTHAKVPEGAACISSRVVTVTPPLDLQPDDS